jgi:hypothetical protein
VPWIEHIPYQATESYQQAYTAYESHLVQVPYTTYQSYTYSCGSGTMYRTCTGSRAVTSYRSESQMRPVTRYRTATRTVTRYRQEPRLFHYEAERVTGEYESDLAVRVQLFEGAPLDVRLVQTQKQHGMKHDVVFEPAGVRPARPNLVSPEGWLREQADLFKNELVATLNKQWRARYCVATRYSTEEAARCAYGARPAPPEAVQVLAGIFGGDAELMQTLPVD